MPALEQLEAEFRQAWASDDFRKEYAHLLQSYAGRPTPVTECHRLSEKLGLRVLLKREDLTHTGSHKINNVLGQALLTRRMGKGRVIAETGRASTASPPPRPRRCSASSARSTWARSTSSARR